MSRWRDADTEDRRIATVNDYVRVYPDDDELDGPFDENWPLTLKMAWLSRAAFISASLPAPVASGSKPAASGSPMDLSSVVGEPARGTD